MLIAHRGRCGKGYGDNTKEGLLYALSIPELAGVELDVRKTKDHELVLIHDPFIPIQQGIGIIKYMTLSSLEQYEFGNLEHPSKISTLSSFLKAVHSQKIIMIEVKDSSMEKELYNIIKNFTYLNLYLCSFDYQFVKTFKEKHPQFKVGLIMGNFINHNDNYKAFDFVSVAYPSIKEIKPKIMKFAWTINDPKLVQELDSQIGIITDDYRHFK